MSESFTYEKCIINGYCDIPCKYDGFFTIKCLDITYGIMGGGGMLIRCKRFEKLPKELKKKFLELSDIKIIIDEIRKREMEDGKLKLKMLSELIELEKKTEEKIKMIKEKAII